MKFGSKAKIELVINHKATIAEKLNVRGFTREAQISHEFTTT